MHVRTLLRWASADDHVAQVQIVWTQICLFASDSCLFDWSERFAFQCSVFFACGYGNAVLCPFHVYCISDYFQAGTEPSSQSRDWKTFPRILFIFFTYFLHDLSHFTDQLRQRHYGISVYMCSVDLVPFFTRNKDVLVFKHMFQMITRNKCDTASVHFC